MDPIAHASPRPANDPSIDSEYGTLITERGVSKLLWIAPVLTTIFALLGAAVMVRGIQARFFSSAPNGPTAIRGVRLTPSPPNWDWLLQAGGGAVMAVVCAALTWYVARQLRTKNRYYELGVRVIVGTRTVRQMAYAECERFWYRTVRQYVHGIYTGTTATITMKANGMPTVRWAGRHKEKPKGLSFTVFGKGEFKGEDELDVVKLVIADAMADEWVDRMNDGESVKWCKQAEFGATEVKILKGKRKGQSLSYTDLDRFSANRGYMHLFARGDEKACLTLGMNDENFWVGMRVMERMWMLGAEDGEFDHAIRRA